MKDLLKLDNDFVTNALAVPEAMNRLLDSVTEPNQAVEAMEQAATLSTYAKRIIFFSSHTIAAYRKIYDNLDLLHLMTLCQPCHQKIHNMPGVQIGFPTHIAVSVYNRILTDTGYDNFKR